MGAKSSLKRVGYLQLSVAALCAFAARSNVQAQVFDKSLPTAAVLAGARTKSSSVAQWAYSYDGSMVRANLDLIAAQILETDPDAKAAVASTLSELGPVINNQEWALEASAQRSSLTVDPNNPIRKMVQEAAVSHGFSPEAIQNLKLWKTMGAVNAYTFSADPERLEVVVYQDLIDIMTPNELRAVFGHELGHIHMKHVLTGIVLEAVYDATGRNLIPQDSQDAFLAVMHDSATALYKRAIDFDGPVADAIIQPLHDLAHRVGTKLYQRTGKDGMIAMAKRFQVALSAGRKLTPSRDGDDNPFKAKLFKQLMTSLTRSQETTADRWAMLTTSPEDLASSMSKLTAGRTGNAKVIMQQAEELLDRAAREHFDLSQIENADHPQTVFRVASAIQYSRTANYQIMRDPFLKALDMYVKMRIEIANGKTRINNNQIELASAEQIQQRNKELVQYMHELGKALEIEIRKEANALKTGAEPKKIKALLAYLDDANSVITYETMPIFTTDDSLFSKLQVELTGPTANEVTKALAAELQTRVPVSATRKSLDAILGAAGKRSPKLKCNALFSGN